MKNFDYSTNCSLLSVRIINGSGWYKSLIGEVVMVYDSSATDYHTVGSKVIHKQDAIIIKNSNFRTNLMNLKHE